MKFVGVVALGALAVTACSDEVEVSTVELPAISDQLHNNGTNGFFFLPPVVPRPGHFGDFVPSATPTVKIDRIDPTTTAVLQSIATYTMTSGPFDEHVRAHPRNAPGEDGDDDPEGYFVVRWKTNKFTLSTSATYRITVSVPNHVLGYADVDLVANKKQFKNVDVEDFTPLIDGDILRIKFRIDRPSVDHDLDGVLDWLDNCPATPNANQTDGDHDGIGDACTATSTIGIAGGHVAGPAGLDLYIPPGAVTQATAITISETVIAPPSGIGAMTPVYKFEPEGLIFVRPVHVEIPVPAGTTSASVYWTRYNSAVFSPLGGTIANNAIGVDITHFSYATVGSGLGVHDVVVAAWHAYIWGGSDGERAKAPFPDYVELWVHAANGQWFSFPRDSTTEGLVTFLGVPNGDYVIRRQISGDQNAYMISDRSAIDIGSNLPGRPPEDRVDASDDTLLDVTLSNLPAWNTSCDVDTPVTTTCHALEIFSPESNSYLFDGQLDPGFRTSPTLGAEYSLVNTTFFGSAKLLDNDTLVAARLEREANHPYKVMTHVGRAENVTTPDHDTTFVSIAMSDVSSQSSLPVNWRGDLYRSTIETDGNPNISQCDFCGSLFGVLATAGRTADGFLTNADLLLLEDNTGQNLPLGDVAYPSSLSMPGGDWGEIVSARFIEQVPYLLPGTTNQGPGSRFGVLVDWTTSRQRIVDAGGVVAPPIAPPRDVRVDGQQNVFFTDGLSIGPGTTLSWEPVPGAQYYSIVIRELTAEGALTRGRNIFQITTRHPSFKIWDEASAPPTITPTGDPENKTYVISISATGGTSPIPEENELLDYSPGRLFDVATANTASGIFGL